MRLLFRKPMKYYTSLRENPGEVIVPSLLVSESYSLKSERGMNMSRDYSQRRTPYTRFSSTCFSSLQVSLWFLILPCTYPATVHRNIRPNPYGTASHRSLISSTRQTHRMSRTVPTISPDLDICGIPRSVFVL